MNTPLNPHLRQTNVGSWASSEFKDKVKYHLTSPFAAMAWFDWNEDLPNQVEVVCGEISRRYGKYLKVRRWLISPAISGLKETLVAEVDIKETSKYSNDEYVQICIRHIVPAVL